MKQHPPFWVTLNRRIVVKGSRGNERGTYGVCVEAPTPEDAKRIAVEKTDAEAVDVANVKTLPYPAEPRINMQGEEWKDACPSFCHDPRRCAGRTACPQPYACSE